MGGQGALTSLLGSFTMECSMKTRAADEPVMRAATMNLSPLCNANRKSKHAPLSIRPSPHTRRHPGSSRHCLPPALRLTLKQDHSSRALTRRAEMNLRWSSESARASPVRATSCAEIPAASRSSWRAAGGSRGTPHHRHTMAYESTTTQVTGCQDESR